MSGSYVLTEFEKWTHFGSGSYKSLDPKESPQLAKQLILTEIEATQYEELAMMANRSLKISAHTMALEEHLFPTKPTSPQQKPVSPSPFPEHSQVSPDLKIRVAARLKELKEKVKSHSLAPLIETARVIETKPELIEVHSAHRYSVFRMGSRRYAIPSEQVIKMGRVSSRHWMSKSVDDHGTAIPLLDLRRVLQIEGEAGQVYMIVQFGNRQQAWVVDGLEGSQQFEQSEIKELPRIGNGLKNPTIAGLRRGGPWDGPPITILHSDRIFQVLSKRPSV